MEISSGNDCRWVDSCEERMRKYRVRRHPLDCRLSPQGSIVVARMDAHADIVTYHVRIFNFELELVVCNLQGNAPSRSANLGCGSQGHVRVESSTERAFAVKRLYAVKLRGPRCGEQVSKQRIESVLLEYAISKIAAVMGLGPDVDTHIGFDVLCYADCLEFHLELCRPATFEDLLRDSELLTQGLRRMHSLHLIHRDIKPANILFSQRRGHCVFADFGISHFVRERIGQRSLAYYEGTRSFMSAEMVALAQMPGLRGYADLYSNDWFALHRTFNLCRSEFRLLLDKSKKYLSHGKTSIRNSQQQKLAQGLNIAKGSINEEEIPIQFLDMQMSTNTTASSVSSILNSTDYSYEFLKLKFHYTSKLQSENSTASCWRSLRDSEAIEVLQLIIDSADEIKVEEALADISGQSLYFQNSKITGKFEELEKVRRWRWYSPEDAHIERETEKSVRNKVRVLGYSDKVLSACESCTKQTPFIKQVENFIRETPDKPTATSKLRQLAGVLHGDNRRDVLRKWEEQYMQEENKQLTELIEIEHFLYVKERTASERIRIIKVLEKYQGCFETSENELLAEIIENLREIVDCMDSAETIKVHHYCSLERSTIQQAQQNTLTEAAYRLSLEWLYELKWRLHRMYNDSENYDPEASDIPETSLLQIKLLNLEWAIKNIDFYSIKEDSQVIIEKLTDEGKEIEVLDVSKLLTYTHLLECNPQQAYIHEQKRLFMLRRIYQFDDFEIVESHLLLAWALSMLTHEFDRGKEVLEKSHQLFELRSRKPIEQLIVAEISLRVGVSRKNNNQIEEGLGRLKAILDQEPDLRYCSRERLWLCGQYGTNMAWKSIKTLQPCYKAHLHYFDQQGVSYQRIMLCLILTLLEYGETEQGRLLFNRRTWGGSSKVRFLEAMVNIRLLISARREDLVNNYLSQCQTILQSAVWKLSSLPDAICPLSEMLWNSGLDPSWALYLKNEVIQTWKEMYEKGLITVDFYAQLLFRQGLVQQNIPLLLKNCQLHKRMDLCLILLVAISEMKDPPEDWLRAIKRRIRNNIKESPASIEIVRFEILLTGREFFDSQPLLPSWYLQRWATYTKTVSLTGEEVANFVLTLISVSKKTMGLKGFFFRLARNALPIYWTRVGGFGSSRKSIHSVMSNIIELTAGDKDGLLETYYLRRFTIELHGGSDFLSQKDIKDSPRCPLYMPLLCSEEEFCESASSCLTQRSRRSHRSAFRAKQLLFQATIMQKGRRQQKCRLLIGMALHLKALGKGEQAKEYIADAQHIFPQPSAMISELLHRIA